MPLPAGTGLGCYLGEGGLGRGVGGPTLPILVCQSGVPASWLCLCLSGHYRESVWLPILACVQTRGGQEAVNTHALTVMWTRADLIRRGQRVP